MIKIWRNYSWKWKKAQWLWKKTGFPKDMKNRLTLWSNKPTSGCVSRRTEIRLFKGIPAPSWSLTRTKMWKRAKCPPTDEWVKTTCVCVCVCVCVYTPAPPTHTCSGSSFSLRRILPCVTTWMSLEDVMGREISQSQKDKYCARSLIQWVEPKVLKLMEGETRTVVAQGSGEEETVNCWSKDVAAVTQKDWLLDWLLDMCCAHRACR